MKPTDAELFIMLKALVHECQEHNREFHHITSPEFLNHALETIEKLEKSLACQYPSNMIDLYHFG